MRMIDADAIAPKLEGKFNQDMVRYAPAIDAVPVVRWIPVTERLPEEDAGDVLVVKNYRGKTYVDIGEIIEGEAYCYSDDYAIHPREHKLTHWMPLPEPPMRKGENG